MFLFKLGFSLGICPGAIVYAGLYHEDKTLTVEKVGDLIDEYSNLKEVAEKIGEALTLAFGEPNKDTKAGE